MSIPHPPRLLVISGLGIVLGVILDAVWPYELFVVHVWAGVGPVVGGLSVVLAVVVLVTWLVAARIGAARSREAAATTLAAHWEARARAQQEAHSRFMRELDHELKNPLQSIKSAFAELDQMDGLVPTIQIAQRQVDRLRVLSGRLRQVATVGSDTLEREPVHLEELVQQACELALAAIGGTEDRIKLIVQHIPWRLAPIQADRELLAQAIYNLLDNALKYSPPTTPIEVHLREDGRAAIIEVADGGHGIDLDDLPHVCEELFRGERTRDVEGSGLGLALASRVVAAHGGTLDFRSRPGSGTVAIMSLPISS